MHQRLVIAAILLVAATFNTVEASYHPTEAFNALYYCKAAYCNSSHLQSWSCGACVDHHPSFTSVNVTHCFSDGFLGFTGYNPDLNQIVVAFRGSANLKNWIKDLDFKKVDYPQCSGCEVHKGFYSTWHSVDVGILLSLQTLTTLYPSASILVTGHSLGAAVALFAALDITQIYPTFDVRLYTFGEPRAGTPTFVAWAATILQTGKQYRLTHKKDPVPHVPPMLFGFLQVPHELWYDNDGGSNYTDCNDSPTKEDPNCSDSVVCDTLHDHVMYLGLCTHCEKQPDPNTGHCDI